MSLRLDARDAAGFAAALVVCLLLAVVLVHGGIVPAVVVVALPMLAVLVLPYRYRALLIGVVLALTVPAWWAFGIPQASIRIAAVLVIAPLILGRWSSGFTLSDGLLLLFFIDSVFGAWLQTGGGTVWRAVFDIFLPVAFYVAGRLAPMRLQRPIVAAVVAAVSVGAVTVIVERLAGHVLFEDPNSYSWVPSVGGIYRPGGVYGSPPAASLALGVGILLSVSLRHAASRRRRNLLSGCTALMLVALVLTFERSAWIALVVGGICYLLLVGRDTRTAVQTVIATGLVIVVAISAYPLLKSNSTYQNGVLRSGAGNTFAARLHIWSEVPPVVTSNVHIAAFGIGFASTILARNAGTVPLALQFSPQLASTSIHNQYLLILVEQGAAGLILFLLFFGSVLVRGFRAAARARDRLSAAMAGSIIVMMIISLANTPVLDRSSWMLTLLLLGLLTSRTRVLSAPQSPPRARSSWPAAGLAGGQSPSSDSSGAGATSHHDLVAVEAAPAPPARAAPPQGRPRLQALRRFTRSRRRRSNRAAES